VFSFVTAEGYSYPRGNAGGPVGIFAEATRLVLEVRGMNCNRMEQKLGRTLVPGHVRCLCP